MAEPTATTLPTPGPAPPPATVAPNAIPSGQVAVFNPDGKLVSIAAKDLPNAQSAGYEVASKEALHARSPTTLYDVGQGLYDVGDTLESGFRGIVHGATAGLNELGDKAVIGALKGDKAAQEYADEVTRQKTEHPLAFGGGELGGMVGGALLGNEAGALTGVGKGLSAAGGFAENLAGRATAGIAARGALGKAVATGIGMGARGAAETGIYSGINELSEESLGKPELNAEKILSAAGSGALGGFLLGGALGGVGSLAKSGYGAVTDFASDVIAKNADKLEGLANEQRWRALDPNLKFTREANARVEGGSAAVGDVLKKYDIVGTDLKTAAREGGIADIGPKIDEAVDKVGKQLGELTGGSAGTVPFSKIHEALDTVIDPLRKVAGREGVVRSLEDYQASLARKLVPETEGLVTKPSAELMQTPITLQDALFQRKGLDQMVYQEAKSLDPNMRVGLLRDFRAKFEGLIVDAFDDAAKAAGNPEAKGQLLGLKKDYQALSIAQDAAEASTSRMQTNRNLSLSDYVSGGIASNIGKGVGGIIGGAPGAFLGGLAGGAAGSLINRVGRDRGNAIAAAALDKASAFARARQAIEKTDEAITAAAKGIVDGPKLTGGSPYRSLPSAVAVTEGGLRSRFDAARDSVKDIQQNAKALTERAMVPSNHLPKTGAAVGQLAMRTAGYLVSQLPAPMVAPTLGKPWPMRVSEPEMSAYLEKFKAATDPTAAMRAFATGRLTMNMATALKEVRPEIFQQIQAEAMDMVIAKQAKGDPLPYDARQRMSILLGIITDPSQDPKMMASLQANLAGSDTTPGAGGPGAGGRPPNSGAQLPSMANKMNKLEES